MKKVILVLILNFLLILSHWKVDQLYADYRTESNKVTTKVGNPTFSAPSGSFVYYCQGNPEWKNTCDLGGGGCGPTSLAMVLSTFGITMTPPQVDQVFRDNGWRSCSDAGSYMVEAVQSSWLSSLGITTGPNLAESDGGPLNITLAKQFIDEGYLIIGSSQQFPCVNCKNSKYIGHIFVVDNVDPTNNTVSIRDPNNCSYTNGDDEYPENIIRSVSLFPWHYAYPLKKL